SRRQLLDVAREFLAFHQLHGDVHGGAVAVEVVDRGDVGVSELLRLGGFALQGNEGFRMLAEVAGQQLHRNIRVAVLRLDLEQVARLVDLAHAAFANGRKQLEAIFQYGAGTDAARSFRRAGVT